MKKTLGHHEWTQLAEKNAKHLAKLHIEAHNAEEIAEAFKDVEAVKALEFLFREAEKCRRENRHKKVALILEAAKMIDRTSGQAMEMTLETSGSGKDEETQLRVKRYTPSEIFDTPIVFTEVVEEEA